MAKTEEWRHEHQTCQFSRSEPRRGSILGSLTYLTKSEVIKFDMIDPQMHIPYSGQQQIEGKERIPVVCGIPAS